MKKQILHFSIHQSSKVWAIVHFILSLIIFIPLSIAFALYTGELEPLLFLFYPFVILFFTYIGAVIFLFIYNIVAKTFGGIEFTTNEEALSKSHL